MLEEAALLELGGEPLVGIRQRPSQSAHPKNAFPIERDYLCTAVALSLGNLVNLTAVHDGLHGRCSQIG